MEMMECKAGDELKANIPVFLKEVGNGGVGSPCHSG